ncbi:hypothetical protein F4U94_20305 [Sphingobium limneticum]|uniref:Uncharacterized protein n=1 Tax=Sphingobium limneticum TaxID=1007511 RepID=A0A5J5HVN1_9SPHN|nr:hypothetical protein F4U94_20305 [Sphingobium limneticum]KAA9012276.1 hypothetical protein F4U96_21510 [Sphingobium limneticum]KAA9024737.1 hypothetical protein F4U95_21625 [Sphingobium limneticum]
MAVYPQFHERRVRKIRVRCIQPTPSAFLMMGSAGRNDWIRVSVSTDQDP